MAATLALILPCVCITARFGIACVYAWACSCFCSTLSACNAGGRWSAKHFRINRRGAGGRRQRGRRTATPSVDVAMLLPNRPKRVLWNLGVTGRCRSVPRRVSGSNPGGPTARRQRTLILLAPQEFDSRLSNPGSDYFSCGTNLGPLMAEVSPGRFGSPFLGFKGVPIFHSGHFSTRRAVVSSIRQYSAPSFARSGRGAWVLACGIFGPKN